MPKLVISLTSYPARINTVYQVIESLFKQRIKADKIVLWLSILEFPGQYKDLPDNLKQLVGKQGFYIEWVQENIKSHKKYFYALQNRDDITITVDDDMYYADTMVSTLMTSYREHPHAISARNVHIITRQQETISSYMTWESEAAEYIGIERTDLCAIGVNGILYPPQCSRDSWFDKQIIMEYAPDQDDIWLKYNEIIDNIPVVYAGIGEPDQEIETSQDSALYIQNAQGGGNDVCIKKLFQNLKKNHRTIYCQWFGNLMRMDELISEKRRYHSAILNDILNKWDQDNLYICGAGKYAHIVMEFIKTCNKEKYIRAFLVTQDAQQDQCKDNDIGIKLIRDLDKQECFGVICGVGRKYREELRAELEPYDSHEWIDLDISGIARLLQLESYYR